MSEAHYTVEDPVIKPSVPRRKSPRRHKLEVQLLEDVEREEVGWLWYPYIPQGKLTMLEGDPGLGKSWIACALAADLSRGRGLPGQENPLPPQKVLMLSAEDGLGDTIRPRVEALDGDLSRIYVSDGSFTLDREGVAELEEIMGTVAATICFIDPVVAYMGNKVDIHRANEVRPIMQGIAQAAKNTGTAVIMVRHLRKTPAGQEGKNKPLYSGIGSIDFTASVRSVLQVSSAPKGGIVRHTKHNLSPEGKPMRYVIEDNRFQWTDEVNFPEPDPLTRPVLRSVRVQEVRDFIASHLREPRPAIEMLKLLDAAGYTTRLVNDARKGFVLSVKQGDGTWVWSLAHPATP